MTSAHSGKPTIEELISRLEDITRNIENPETGLENSIALYEEGLTIADNCKKRLLQQCLNRIVLKVTQFSRIITTTLVIK